MRLKSFEKDGVTYYQLFLGCPVCYDIGESSLHHFWKHGRCGGIIYVGDNAFYFCGKCGFNEHVTKWHYGCPSHSGQDDYYIFDHLDCIYDFCHALGTLGIGQMVNETGFAWLQRFFENMQKCN